ncbi:FadR/GntR family transcriptional regulator [Microbacterium sp. X-17]|uniref:FadR/GntR family transcriptional regulator n=1 Tax=Microbacterium sp. X-17 TaxID=3144404 RepID=UPI0031F566C1
MGYLASSGLHPGQRLPSERRMAETLGVGRAALRHALKSLSVLGVLEVRPGSGAFLRGGEIEMLPHVIEWGLLLGEKRVEDVTEARAVLEVSLAGLAAERRTSKDIQKLESLVEQMQRAVDDLSRYVELDVEFHMAIADAAQNEVLAGVLRSLQSLLHAWAGRVISAAGETKSSLSMHIPILEAITDGDAYDARESMRAHMTRASTRLRGAVEIERALGDR